MAKNLITLLLTIAFLNSCSTISTTRSVSPHFDGVITFSAEALSSIKIMLSITPNDKHCFKAKKFSTTDKQGKFNLKAITEEYKYTPFASNELDEWTVCAKYKDKIYTLYTNNNYGSGNITGSVYLDCNLAVSPSNKACVASH